jgi:hypothetical protein
MCVAGIMGMMGIRVRPCTALVGAWHVADVYWNQRDSGGKETITGHYGYHIRKRMD